MIPAVQASGAGASVGAGTGRRLPRESTSAPAGSASAETLLALHRALMLKAPLAPSPGADRVGAGYRLEQPAGMVLDVRA